MHNQAFNAGSLQRSILLRKILRSTAIHFTGKPGSVLPGNLTLGIYMKRIAFILWSLLALGCTPKTDVIPKSVVGIWVSSDAVLSGELLIEGQAIYLGADGAGALLSGPPPIGVKIEASFNPSTNVIDYKIFENGKTVGESTVRFDASNNTIISGKNQDQILSRRFENLTGRTKKAIGI